MTESQNDYSERFQVQFDLKSRIPKAKKIQKIINEFSTSPLKTCSCLDVGCSTGININYLAEYTGFCAGIDIDHPALCFAQTHAQPNVVIMAGDALYLPFHDESFDIIICSHIYEHVPDAVLLMDEIYRVLKTGGFCYFAAGNKFSLVEPHYRLPFLSWLPKRGANLYLRMTKKGTTYSEKHRTYFALKRLVHQFSITDYTVRILKEPERYGAEDMIGPNSVIQMIPSFVFWLLKPLIPTYIFILKKL